MKVLDTKASLQDVEIILQETLATLKETEEMEGEAAKSPQEEEEVEKIVEPSPQPNLHSYYKYFEACLPSSVPITIAVF